MDANGRDDQDTREHPDIELVTVLETGDKGLLALAEGILEGAEIPYLARGEMIQDLFGLGRLTAVNPITGPVAIQVDRRDLADAQALLADLLAPGGDEGEGDEPDDEPDVD